jgi:hypothetical protein
MPVNYRKLSAKSMIHHMKQKTSNAAVKLLNSSLQAIVKSPRNHKKINIIRKRFRKSQM